MKAMPVLLAILLAAFCPDIPVENLRTDQVHYAYEEPTNAQHRWIHDRLKELQVLERLSEFLKPFRFPHTLTLKVLGCDGRVNAFYWDYEVKVCYEYFDLLLKSASKERTAIQLNKRDALIGMTADVFLHETGHAVFDILQIPFLGREEDAADQFSSYIMLQFPKEEARRLILGVAFLGRDQAQQDLAEAPGLREFSDVHGLPAQRYFNLLCMAYGSDPILYASAITIGGLPERRAKNCRYEYRRFQFGFEKLIRPYIDDELLGEVKAKSWFHFDASDAAVDQ